MCKPIKISNGTNRRKIDLQNTPKIQRNKRRQMMETLAVAIVLSICILFVPILCVYGLSQLFRHYCSPRASKSLGSQDETDLYSIYE